MKFFELPSTAILPRGGAENWISKILLVCMEMCRCTGPGFQFARFPPPRVAQISGVHWERVSNGRKFAGSLDGGGEWSPYSRTKRQSWTPRNHISQFPATPFFGHGSDKVSCQCIDFMQCARFEMKWFEYVGITPLPHSRFWNAPLFNARRYTCVCRSCRFVWAGGPHVVGPNE